MGAKKVPKETEKGGASWPGYGDLCFAHAFGKQAAGCQRTVYHLLPCSAISGEWPALRYRVVKAYITCTIANDGEDAVTVRADGTSIGVFGFSKAGQLTGHVHQL